MFSWIPITLFVDINSQTSISGWLRKIFAPIAIWYVNVIFVYVRLINGDMYLTLIAFYFIKPLQRILSLSDGKKKFYFKTIYYSFKDIIWFFII